LKIQKRISQKVYSIFNVFSSIHGISVLDYDTLIVPDTTLIV